MELKFVRIPLYNKPEQLIYINILQIPAMIGYSDHTDLYIGSEVISVAATVDEIMASYPAPWEE